MRYVKNTMDIAEKQKLEVAQMDISSQARRQEQQEATLDYIAMMADVDLSDIATTDDSEEGMVHEPEV